MKKFTQLTIKERYQISAYIKVGYTQKEIVEEGFINSGADERKAQKN